MNCCFTDENIEIYSLHLNKRCVICNISYKADKPWYYHCKPCSKNIPNKKTTQCVLCRKEFFKDIKTLKIVSGEFTIPSHYFNRTFNSYRILIPSHLRDKEINITQGTHFRKQICFNHLSLANEQIAGLSNRKALIWSRRTSYPQLFRLKCLKISCIFVDYKDKCKILYTMDNCFPALKVLLDNNLPLELRQIILKTLC